jgi:hypothetical protein
MTQPTDLPATAPPTAPPRPVDLDNFRVLLTVLVVLFHVALTYGNLPIWYYHEPARTRQAVSTRCGRRSPHRARRCPTGTTT